MAKIVKMHAGGARIAVRALAAFAAFSLALAPRVAEAGFTRVKSIDKGGRQTLDDQTIYRLDSNDVTVNAGSGLSAYEVSPNATAVLYIPAGSTLTLKAGAASGTSGAGAGIEVPENSTLIIVGAGTIVANGGKGGSGAGGENGQNADVDCDDDHGRGSGGDEIGLESKQL